ncbi:hypothetical protein lerEdw1_007394 [Lerista edwardsae]|nr:hypothetical protein lerEdw1_007394 [Lerista edwardsae]
MCHHILPQQGEVECSFTPCPTLECPRDDWLLAPGQCCFTCRKAAPMTGEIPMIISGLNPLSPASLNLFALLLKFCSFHTCYVSLSFSSWPGCFVDDNGVEFPVGQIWSPGDPCELCICQVNDNLLYFTVFPFLLQADGSVSCKRTDCLETCPHPIRIPGQCCPDCSAGCAYAGKIYYNNETFPSVLDPCLSCICLLGSVACSPVDCVIFCTYPFHPEGECCPVCHDCNYKGRKVVNGHNFVPEGEPCIHCTCQLGEVTCEKRPCPSICAEPFAPPARCCPHCQGNKLTDSSASLENSLPISQLDGGGSKTVFQAFKGHSTALMSDRTCSLCTGSSTPSSLSSEVHLAESNAVVWRIPPVSPTAPGNVERHETRPGDPVRLHFNRPPSVKPPSSWLGHSTISQIKAGATWPLLRRLESLRPPATRPSSFGSPSTYPNLFSLITTEISVPSTTVNTATPSPVANVTDSVIRPFHPSVPLSLPLPFPAEPLPPSASSSVDSPSQEHFGGPSHMIDSSIGQPAQQGINSTLLPKDASDLNGTAP